MGVASGITLTMNYLNKRLNIYSITIYELTGYDKYPKNGPPNRYSKITHL